MKEPEAPLVLQRSGGFLLEPPGELSAICHHEAGHAVAGAVCGMDSNPVAVWRIFETATVGDIVIRTCGAVAAVPIIPTSHPIKVLDLPDAPPAAADEIPKNWRALLPPALIAAAGPVGESRYREEAGLPPPDPKRWTGDLTNLRNTAQKIRNMRGRRIQSIQDYAWRQTVLMIEDKEVWTAIRAIADEMFIRARRNEPADPQPGMTVETTMPADDLATILSTFHLDRLDIHGNGPHVSETMKGATW